MNLSEGDIVQINLEHPKFPGLLVVVTEPKSWGCQGYILSPFDLGESVFRYNNIAYVRMKTEDFVKVGAVEWMLNSEDT